MDNWENNGPEVGSGKKINKGKLVAFLIVAVCGIQFIVSSAVFIYRYYMASHYYTASVDGVITGVVVKRNTSTSSRHHRRRSTTSYYPKYSFTVDGVTYNDLSYASYDKDYCVEGNPAVILYDPENPRKNCLIGDVEAFKVRAYASPPICAVGVLIIVCGWRAVYGKKNGRQPGRR